MLTENGAASDNSLPDSHAKSCTAKILLGGDRWTKNTDWIEDGALIAETGVGNGPDIAVDVTKTVRAWASGQENRGFVLEGEEENLTAFTEKACVTQYFPESPSARDRVLLSHEQAADRPGPLAHRAGGALRARSNVGGRFMAVHESVRNAPWLEA